MDDYQTTQIWFATNRRAHAWLKFRAYDDIGCLFVQPGTLSFHGACHSVSITKIRDIQLTCQRPNWITQLLLVTFLYALLTTGGVPVVVAIAIVGCQLLLAFSINRAMTWVKITYESENSLPATGWFADGGTFGWAGVLGGTRKLNQIISSAANSSEPTTVPVVLGRAPYQPNKRGKEECPYCEETVVPDEDDRCPACDRPI